MFTVYELSALLMSLFIPAIEWRQILQKKAKNCQSVKEIFNQNFWSILKCKPLSYSKLNSLHCIRLSAILIFSGYPNVHKSLHKSIFCGSTFVELINQLIYLFKLVVNRTENLCAEPNFPKFEVWPNRNGNTCHIWQNITRENGKLPIFKEQNNFY